MLFRNNKFRRKGCSNREGRENRDLETGLDRGYPVGGSSIAALFFCGGTVVRNWRLIQGENAARVEIDETDEPEFGDGDEEWGEEEGVNVHVWVPTPHFVISIMAICLTGLIGYAMYLIGGK